MENKELLFDYLEVTIGHLLSDIENVRDCNASFYGHYEHLDNQTESMETTALLIESLLDSLKKAM
ncbi:hypothetical protein DQM09_08105 [Leuconostoc mesenteroides subsp. mesenteroides]|uniref:hypothetical protein n=1 Tax=Leuconostoc mesenteroides TaxID=1245 RepID=UPI000E09B680|nr:hypothetical protein [Leuconostoc mesenteroides]RDF90864.1 hypothetical protein DQM09_08105 [Leuconostoc mesenteroides subsp. mesenteroides]